MAISGIYGPGGGAEPCPAGRSLKAPDNLSGLLDIELTGTSRRTDLAGGLAVVPTSSSAWVACAPG